MVSCTPPLYSISPTSSLLPPILTLPPKRAPNPPPSALRPTRNTPSRPLQPIHSPLSIPSQRPLTLQRPPLLIFTPPLSAVNPLFGERVAYGLGETAFTELAADEVVDAILEVVDLVDACDFCFVEFFCRGVRGVERRKGRRVEDVRLVA